MISNTLEEVGCTDYKMFLSDSGGNFRVKLYPEYKANRTAPKPKWLEELKEHLIVKWGASISFGAEADDSLSIHQDIDTVICSIDKDLFQCPGLHYNFVTKMFRTVSNEEGIKWFYTQLLTGDVIDNIKGVKGIGKAKAAKILEKASTEEEYFLSVRDTYEKKYGEDGIKLMLLYGKLLKIRTEVNEEWTFPSLDIQVR